MLELRRKPKGSGGKADEAVNGAMDVHVGTDEEPPSLPDDVVCRPPTFSALRRFDLGEVDLPELTWFEELALSLYHTKTYIVTVGPRSKDGQTVVGKNRVRAIMGHTLAFEQDPDQLMAHLTASDDPGPLNSFPIPASSLSKLVSVYFLGPPTQLGCVLLYCTCTSNLLLRMRTPSTSTSALLPVVRTALVPLVRCALLGFVGLLPCLSVRQ
jgi:hypothetical protein